MTSIVLGFADQRAPAARLAAQLDLPYREVEVHRFPDQEALVRVPEIAETVIFYRSLADPDRKLIELMLASVAAREAGAARVILVAPYLAYMRQDQAFRPGEAVSQRVVGRFLASHFDGVLTVDPHLHRVSTLAEVVPGIPAVSISAGPLIAAMVDCADRPFIVGPDSESRQWTQTIADALGLDMIVGEKVRRGDRDVSLSLGDLASAKGRPAVLVDDMISSGHTLCEAAIQLLAAGASRVDAIVTHCLANPADLARLRAAGVSQVSSCDSIEGPTARAHLAPLLAAALREARLV